VKGSNRCDDLLFGRLTSPLMFLRPFSASIPQLLGYANSECVVESVMISLPPSQIPCLDNIFWMGLLKNFTSLHQTFVFSSPHILKRISSAVSHSCRLYGIFRMEDGVSQAGQTYPRT
jgi:hypothetical protein